MLSPIPYADVAGYKRRAEVRPEDVDLLESLYPSYLQHRIARASSYLNARLQKRYRVPLGQEAPTLVPTGTAPPLVVLSGRPTLGSLEMAVEVTTGGPVGTAVMRWSSDGGLTWTTGVLTAPTVVLGGTGLTATFPSGSYATDNVYSASTPVPEIALGWLVSLVNVDFWKRRGANPQDPTFQDALDARTEALAEVKEAADSKDGLFDLPTNDAVGDSAIVHGGPLSYTEASPFVAADMQERQGVLEDERGCGTYGGGIR